MLAAKHDNLSLNPRTYMVDEENSSDVHTHTIACTHLSHTYSDFFFFKSEDWPRMCNSESVFIYLFRFFETGFLCIVLAVLELAL